MPARSTPLRYHPLPATHGILAQGYLYFGDQMSVHGWPMNFRFSNHCTPVAIAFDEANAVETTLPAGSSYRSRDSRFLEVLLP